MSFIHYIESIQFYTPLRHWLQSIESSPLSCVIKSAMNRYLILLVIKMKQDSSKQEMKMTKIRQKISNFKSRIFSQEFREI